jgi:hypothetical protein
VTGVGRAVEPVDGEIPLTVGALGALGTTGGSDVGADGDCPSQAADPITNASRSTRRTVLVVMRFPLLFRKRESASRN